MASRPQNPAASILARAPAKPIPRSTLVEGMAWVARFRSGALALTQGLHDRYGPVVQNGGGLLRSVSLFGPEANRFVLLDRQDALSARGSWELIMGRIFGGGLLLRDGDDHRHHRRIMQEAFRTPALAAYCDGMNPAIAEGLSGWLARGSRLLAFPALKRLTLDLAFRTFVGVRLDGQQAERMIRHFEATVSASMSLLRLPIPGLEFHAGLVGRQAMGEWFASLIPERRAKPGSDMLSRMCLAESEDGDRLDDDEIVDHMIFLMMAAHDTTTSTMTSLLYLLARHPEWQERVREESLALGSEAVGSGDLDRLESLTHAIHETLRLYPPLSTIPRMARRDFDFEGFRIREGSLVSVYPIHTHRMPEWWSEPDRFDPERFARGRMEHRRHSHLYLPFGGGAHMCLGLRFAEMQMRCVVHQLVQLVRWEVPAGYEMPVQEAPISKPTDGLPLRLRRLA